MIEIERKRRLTLPVDEFRKILSNNGYLCDLASQTETDIYFSRPDVDYMKTVECLRLRIQKDKVEVTYKPASNKSTVTASGIVSKKEVNVYLKSHDEVDSLLNLFENIGLVKLCTVKKIREKYHKEDKSLTISIDIIEGAGNFIEVEVMSKDKELAISMIDEAESILKIKNMPIQTLPYRDIVMGLK